LELDTTMNELSFQQCTELHWNASKERQNAGLKAWHNALLGSEDSPPRIEQRLSLKELAKVLHRHPSVLWRLGVVEHCGESFGGGRKLYRENEVVEYLKSGTALKYRAALRQKRKTINT